MSTNCRAFSAPCVPWPACLSRRRPACSPSLWPAQPVAAVSAATADLQQGRRARSCSSTARRATGRSTGPAARLRRSDVFRGRAVQPARVSRRSRTRQADRRRDPARIMPPWLPERGHGVFANERRLRDDQIATHPAMGRGGRREGDPADRPPLPTWPDGWQLGQPDLVLTTAGAVSRCRPPAPTSSATSSCRCRWRRPATCAPSSSAPAIREACTTRASASIGCACPGSSIGPTGTRFRGDARRSGAERVRLDAGQGAVHGAGRPRVDARDRQRPRHAAAHAADAARRNWSSRASACSSPTRRRPASRCRSSWSRRRSTFPPASRLRDRGQLRAAGRRRVAERLSARALPGEGDARHGDASRRHASRR